MSHGPRRNTLACCSTHFHAGRRKPRAKTTATKAESTRPPPPPSNTSSCRMVEVQTNAVIHHVATVCVSVRQGGWDEQETLSVELFKAQLQYIVIHPSSCSIIKKLHSTHHYTRLDTSPKWRAAWPDTEQKSQWPVTQTGRPTNDCCSAADSRAASWKRAPR